VIERLKEMEEPLCRLPGWVDHGTHVLLVAHPLRDEGLAIDPRARGSTQRGRSDIASANGARHRAFEPATTVEAPTRRPRR
jgi:hypothetical protein